MGLFDNLKKDDRKSSPAKDEAVAQARDRQPEKKKQGGHGSHWRIIAESGDEIQRLVMDSVAHAGSTMSTKDNGVDVGAFFSKDGRLKAFAMTHGGQIWTAYPFSEGISHEVTLVRVAEWMNGLEAQIHCSLGGASISFFDGMYFHHKGTYEAGKAYNFSLSALAYRISKAEPQVIKDKSGRELKTKGMAGFFPVKGGDVDDFMFIFPVKEVSEFRSLGKDFYRIRAPLFRLSGNNGFDDIDIYLYVSKNGTGGYVPAVGDDVTGILWLQGYLRSK